VARPLITPELRRRTYHQRVVVNSRDAKWLDEYPHLFDEFDYNI
jgi:predicted LPLAT superfamily acyltransferase